MRTPSLVHRIILSSTILFCSLLLFSGCSSKAPQQSTDKGTASGKEYAHPTLRPYVIKGVRYYPIPSAVGYKEKGRASWYGKQFHGRKTANGETYDMYGDTAAHKTLPMHTMLLVKNLENGKEIVVRVNDRGPFVKSRIIDLTYTGAKNLGMLQNGTAKVEIIAISETPQPEEQEVETTIVETTIAEPAPAAQPTISATAQKNKPATSGAAAVAQTPQENVFEQGNFFVQVGAFIEVENARKRAKLFASKGRDVVIQQYPAAGMNLYRVLVFAARTLPKAKEFEHYLEQKGYPDALIIAR